MPVNRGNRSLPRQKIIEKPAYENLYQALQICLEQRQSPYDNYIWGCLYQYLDSIGDRDRQRRLTEAVYDTLSAHKPEQRPPGWERDIILLSGDLANCYLENQEYDKAREICQQTLTLIPQLQNIESSQKQFYLASPYHQLGYVAHQLREFQQAQSYYQQALEIKSEYGDRYSQAITLHQLGMVAQELREFQQAQSYYQQALKLYIQYGDRSSQALTYEQMGLLAQELGDLQSAKTNLLQVLAIFAEFEDRHILEIIVRILASVYQQTQDEDLIAEAAGILNVTSTELKELFGSNE